MNDCLLFFVKYPEPGEVKTRLAEDTSPEMAAEFYEVFAAEKLVELNVSTDFDVVVAFAPEIRKDDMPDWLGDDNQYIGQKGGELGRRMENAFREAFLLGYERVVLAGSDIPGLTPAIVAEGLNSLTTDTACIGPADDGGYYLIGFHKQGFVPQVFRSMEWSTEDVFQQTAKRLDDSGKAYVELPRLEDTDTLEDVETLAALGSVGPLGGKALALARKMTGM